MPPIFRMESVVDKPKVDHKSYLDPILTRYDFQVINLVQILREAQESFGYLHPDAIDYLINKLNVPRTKIEGVASFYSFFYLEPRGKYRALFSDNITDRMLDNQSLMARLCRNLWVEPGKLSEDGLVSVDFTSCSGICDQGPTILVNNFAITLLTEQRVDEICDLIRNQAIFMKYLGKCTYKIKFLVMQLPALSMQIM